MKELTIPRGIAGSAKIAVHLNVSLRNPDGMAALVVPCALSGRCQLIVLPVSKLAIATNPETEFEVHTWTLCEPPKL